MNTEPTTQLPAIPPLSSSDLLGGKQRTVWVGAWMNQGRLGHWRFQNVTLPEAVGMAKALFTLEWAHAQAVMGNIFGGEVKRVNVSEIKIGDKGVEFRASNKFLYACTKRAFSS
jgi:hypothetical protein